MRIEREQILFRRGRAVSATNVRKALGEIHRGIEAVVWPPRARDFSIRPIRKGNGVTPIKQACMRYLERVGWQLEQSISLAKGASPGPIDAVKRLPNGKLFALEWETGNISSSHRAMNKMLMGMKEGILSGGVLVLPTRTLYQFLTDRVGNFEELEPYFPVWDRPDVNGVLMVIAVEFDRLRNDVRLIRKGTDGRALV